MIIRLLVEEAKKLPGEIRPQSERDALRDLLDRRIEAGL
jgi:hypothetical protein